MKVQEAPMELLNLDKGNWKRYRFDQIATSIGERVEPKDTDIQIYYGLEHLDSGSLHLKRSGTPADVEGTKLRVYPGDVIFGKRRAYQRKAAVCEVDAICSAHAMVLRANPKVIHPRLFPFFLHSDAFMNRAIDISVGSLSPTINWGTLKVQEFLLPPLEQQEKLAELLWAGDAVIEKASSLLIAIESSLAVVVQKACFESKSAVLTPFQDIIEELEAGISINCEAKAFVPTDIGVLKTSAITGNHFDPLEAKTVPAKDFKKLKQPLRMGRILFNRKNTPSLVGSSKYLTEDYDNLFCPDLIWQITIDEKRANPEFIWNYMKTRKFRTEVTSLSNGSSSSMVNVSQQKIMRIKIPLPPIKAQLDAITQLKQLESSKASVVKQVENSKLLLAMLTKHIFQP